MTTQLEHLTKLYEFASWRDAPAPEERLFVWRFRLGGEEIEGWSAHRVQRVELKDVLPSTVSVWRHASKSAALLAIDVYEAPSRSAAREQLLRLLGEFQGPALKRRDTPGEVAFAAGDAALLFARANLVAFVRSVEREPAPAAAIAAQFDQYIAARPPAAPSGGPNLTSVRALDAGAAGRGRPVALHVELAERDRERTWFKFFSRSGDLRLEQGNPTYVPAGPGPHEVTVYAVGPGGLATKTDLRLE